MAKTEYPKFIKNTPCGEDLFESGSHKKTADSISEHIKNNASGYKLIGLEGEWGSGKSNVIKIIENDLGSKFHFFIYDAWSHQEDLQRRSFLEELTDYLQQKGLFKKDWKEELKNLLAKKKNTTTKTIPKLSIALIVAIILAIVTPIAKSVSDSLPSMPANKYNTAKWIITSGPSFAAILIAIIYFILVYLKKRKYTNQSFTIILKDFVHSLSYIYI